MKPIKQVIAKGPNKRINIFLFDDPQGRKTFLVQTRTLIDFKTRHIASTTNAYSVETFAVLNDLFSLFLEDPEIKNKILHRDLSQTRKFSAITDLRSINK